MAEHGLEGIDHTIQQTYTWIDEIAEATSTFEPAHRLPGASRVPPHGSRPPADGRGRSPGGANCQCSFVACYTTKGWDPEALPVIIRDGQAFLSDFAWDARLPDSVNTAASVRVPMTCSLAT